MIWIAIIAVTAMAAANGFVALGYCVRRLRIRWFGATVANDMLWIADVIMAGLAVAGLLVGLVLVGEDYGLIAMSILGPPFIVFAAAASYLWFNIERLGNCLHERFVLGVLDERDAHLNTGSRLSETDDGNVHHGRTSHQ